MDRVKYVWTVVQQWMFVTSLRSAELWPAGRNLKLESGSRDTWLCFVLPEG